MCSIDMKQQIHRSDKDQPINSCVLSLALVSGVRIQPAGNPHAFSTKCSNKINCDNNNSIDDNTNNKCELSQQVSGACNSSQLLALF